MDASAGSRRGTVALSPDKPLDETCTCVVGSGRKGTAIGALLIRLMRKVREPGRVPTKRTGPPDEQPFSAARDHCRSLMSLLSTYSFPAS